MSAKELIKIPIWKGNRTIEIDHANKIRDAVGANVKMLDSGYRIIHYNESDITGKIVKQSYLIDGQHRVHVLKEHFLGSICEPDFEVVVTEKDVDSETDAISFFNAINNVKPQQWRTDPAILVNKYIVELEKLFNKKTKFIRNGTTVRPYLSVDNLRVALNTIQLPQEPLEIQAFCKKIVDKNKELLKQSDMLILANTKHSKYYERAAASGFMLAVDKKMRWLSEIVQKS
jgi:hypothetical protein